MMRAAARLNSLLTRLRRDARGVSAVEFALLAPIMIALYFGCVGVSDGVAIDRKVSLTAAALADLSSRVTTISSDDMSNIFNASSAILEPYSAGPLKMTISCLNIDTDGKVTVKWSETQGGSKLTNFAFDDTNAALKIPDTQLIYSQVSYAYTPVVGTSIVGTLNLSDHMFMSPRISPPSYDDGGDVEECKSS